MVTILTPLSLPQDIQNQTIYTVVSKPVRRIELIWGRMIGFMAIVTVLVLVFGGISLLYLSRTVGGTIRDDRGSWPRRGRAERAGSPGATSFASRPSSSGRGWRPGCLSTASLTFLDSLGTPHIDRDRRRPGAVEHASRGATSRGRRRRPRSGSYGVVPRPVTTPARICSTAGFRSPTCSPRDSIEGLLNHIYRAPDPRSPAPRRAVAGATPQPRRRRELDASDRAQPRSSSTKIQALSQGSQDRAPTSWKRGPRPPRRPASRPRPPSLRQQAAALHSPADPASR